MFLDVNSIDIIVACLRDSIHNLARERPLVFRGTIRNKHCSQFISSAQSLEQLYALKLVTDPGSAFPLLSAGSGVVLESKSFDSPIAFAQTVLVYIDTPPLYTPQ